MPVPFSSTLRALDADRGVPRAIFLSLGIVLLSLWLVWLATARVDLTADSLRARLVPTMPPQLLAAPADGTVAALDVRLGAAVSPGQVLARLDSPALRNALAQARSHRAALLAQLAAGAAQARAQRAALADDALAAAAQAGQLAAELRRAQTAAALAASDRRRRDRLLAAGLLSAADSERSHLDADQLDSAAAALALSSHARSRDRRAAAADRRALLDQQAATTARLRGDLAATDNDLAGLTAAIAALTVRAPFAGRLGQPSPLHLGSPVRRGDPLLTVAPAAACHVLADFPAAARATLRLGQPARVTLPATPAAPPAVLRATVAAIAAAAVAIDPDTVTVELNFAPALPTPTTSTPTATPPTLFPGTPCDVEVELARSTPLALALAALAPGPRPRPPVPDHP